MASSTQKSDIFTLCRNISDRASVLSEDVFYDYKARRPLHDASQADSVLENSCWGYPQDLPSGSEVL